MFAIHANARTVLLLKLLMILLTMTAFKSNKRIVQKIANLSHVLIATYGNRFVETKVVSSSNLTFFKQHTIGVRA